MKFCPKGIDNLEVFAPNGQPSELFSHLLYAFNNDKDLALDAYLLTKTSAFMDWYSIGGSFDQNGEARLMFAQPGKLFYSNGYDLKSATDSQEIYIQPDLSFDLKYLYSELLASGYVKSSGGRLVTTDNPISYTEVNKILSKYPGSAKLLKIGFGDKGTPIYHINFLPVQLHSSLQISPDEDFTAEEDSDFYKGKGKVFIRTNTFQRTFSSYAKMSASRKIEDYLNSIADRVWREQRDKVDENGLLEIRQGAGKRKITKEEFKAMEEKKQKFPALFGKALHALFASKDEKDPIRAKMFADMAEEYRIKAQIEKEDFELYAELYPAIKDKLNDSSTDHIFNEFTVTLDIGDFEFVDKDAIKHIVSGFGGTIDRLVRHEDGSYTMTDFKTGHLMAIGDKLMAYANEAGVRMVDNSLNRNTINLVMYALMLRAKDRTVKFRDINFLKVTKEGKVELMSSGQSFDFDSALRLIEEYFKKNHNPFYANNQDLFDVSEYFSADTFLKTTIKEHKVKEGVSTEEARETVIRSITVKFREVVEKLEKFPYDNTKLSEESLKKKNELTKEYNTLLAQLLELRVGYNPFKYGGVQYMDILQSLFGNRYSQENNLIASLSTLYAQAKQQVRGDFIDIRTEHDKYLKAMLDEQKVKKKLVGANYEDLYGFMWHEKGDVLGVVTYEDAAWSKLTKVQKDYADFFRWSTRYHLFRTMKPEEGIKFIEAELKKRTDLNESQRKLLTDQIEQLKKVPNFDRFAQAGYPGFIYYEGWVPRVIKTKEESGSVSKYVSDSFKANFVISDEELINQLMPNSKDRITGLPLRYMGPSEGTSVTHGESYTYNFEIMFNAFVSHMIAKEHMDDVYNIGIGIKNFMQISDNETNRTTNKRNIEFVDSFLKGVVLGKRQNSFSRTIKIAGQNVNIDHAIRSLRSYFGVTTLALNVVGAVSTGINQSLKTMQAAIVGTIGAGNQDMDLKASRKMFREILKWKKDQMLGRVSGTPEALAVNKLALFLNLFGYLPKSYNYYDTGESHTQLLSKQGFIAPSWVNNDLLMKLYSSVDNLNYATYLTGQLYKMTTKVKGKEVAMWDAYEVVNGKLVYIGDDRGVNAQTGEKISELTSQEIDKLRAFAERDLGPYREDERSAMDNSSLGSLYMMFKRWLPTTIRRAFKGEHKNMTLGKFMQIKDEIDPETGLPVMRWIPRTDEGFVTSFMKFMNILRMTVVSRDAGTFSKEWKNFTPTQRENLAYAIVRLATFFALMAIISAIFGDNDEDDKNKLKRSAIRIKNDTVFEFIAFDWIRWKDTLVSAPALEKLIETTSAYSEVFFESALPDLFGFEPNTVQSGDFKGWYKGSVSAIRGTKYASTAFGFWELGSQWNDLEDDLNKTRVQ